MLDRFQAKIDVNHPSGCHVWIGSRAANGYGNFRHNNRVRLVHRMAWERAYGPIPDGMCVCHHCDNRACVKPAHLFLGTQSDNMLDASSKGRIPSHAGTACGRAKLTEAEVVAIRAATISHRELAKKYGVHKSTIWAIRARQSWGHL